MNTMIEKARVMLAMQDEINRHVDADWRARGREWYRAIWIECAELMEHHGGWKWWKHGEADLHQVVLEIVDIWHFGLSMRLEGHEDVGPVAASIVDEWNAPPAPVGFLREVERLALAALGERRFAAGVVRNLMVACNRDFDDLYRAYVAKNVLNVFRQDHGYKRGEYVKVWNGREDNEVLVDLMRDLDSDDPSFRDAVYGLLASRYREVARGAR